MRNLSRVFFRCVSSIFVLFLLLQFFPSSVFAQTQQSTTSQQQTFARPNVEENVPLNQHTYVQSMFIEFMLTIQCQITGIDLARQGQPCLGLNMTTGKLGYAPPEIYQNGQLPGTSILGMLNRGIAVMFTPVAGSQEYIKYVAGEFGIAKTAMAAPATGFEGLSPILGLWTATRDLAYYVLIVAFIFIGIGVMLRIHIDPRTVMTVQNQIPRVIICIILITFSYAMAGLLIDTMWSVTYMGVNKLTSAAGSNPQVGCATADNNLGKASTANILQQPLMFFNETFMGPGFGCATGGIIALSGTVGASMAAIQTELLNQLLVPDCSFTDNPWWSYLPPFTPFTLLADTGSCVVEAGIHTIMQWIVALAWILIALVIIIISLLRIWFTLLKAYAMTFIYVILGPLWIVMGLLPKKPLGFEKWIRVLFANLAVFPATAFLLVLARVLTDKFSGDTGSIFVPPLVGDPGAGHLGGLIAFAILLVTPSILDSLREKLGVPPSKAYQGAVQTFNTGRQAATYPAKQGVKHLNARDQQGNAIGFLAGMKDAGTKKVADKVGSMGSVGRFLTKGHDKKEYQKKNISLGGYAEHEKGYNKARNYKLNDQGKEVETTLAEKQAFDRKYKGSVTDWAEDTREAEVKAARKKAMIASGYQPENTDAPAPTGTVPTAPVTPTTGGNVVVDLNIRVQGGGTERIPIQGNEGRSVRDIILPRIAPTAAAAFDTQHPGLGDKPLDQLDTADKTTIENFSSTWHTTPQPPPGDGTT